MSGNDLNHQNDCGFTVLELLVVLSIGILIFAVGLPRLTSNSKSTEFQLTVTSLRAHLTNARAEAMRSARNLQVEIDAETRAIRIGGDRFTAPVQGSAAIARSIDENTDLTEPVTIVFHPDGSATPGSLVITNGSRRAVLSVDWLTGRASIDEASEAP